MRESIVLHAGAAAGTRDVGAALAHALEASPADRPLVIALSGELGAGKTTLVSGLLHAQGYRGTVKSPTYTLVETYELNGRSFHHLDLYRLQHPSELEALGFQDLLQAGAVVLVEWAERSPDVLRNADMSIRIEYSDDPEAERQVTFTAGSELGQRLMDSMASSGFDQ